MGRSVQKKEEEPSRGQETELWGIPDKSCWYHFDYWLTRFIHPTLMGYLCYIHLYNVTSPVSELGQLQWPVSFCPTYANSKQGTRNSHGASTFGLLHGIGEWRPKFPFRTVGVRRRLELQWITKKNEAVLRKLIGSRFFRSWNASRGLDWVSFWVYCGEAQVKNKIYTHYLV